MDDPTAPWESSSQEPPAPWENTTPKAKDIKQDINDEKSASANFPQQTEPQLNPVDRGAAKRMLGVGELINNSGVGKIMGFPSNDILENAINIADKQGKGKGIFSAVGEMAGDPLSWMGGAELSAAKGAVNLGKVGAKYGALSGISDTGAKNIGQNLKNSVENASIGAIATPAIGIGGKKLVEGVADTGKTLLEGLKARAPEALDRVTQNLSKQGDTAFKAMRNSGVRIIPEKSEQIVNNIAQELVNSTGKNDSALHGGTLKILKDMQRNSSKGFDIEDLHIYQKRLAQVINKNSVAGGNKEDAFKANAVKDLIDENIDNLKETDIPHEARNAINQLHVGKAVWAQMRKFEAISDIVKKADGDPNRMKNLLEQLKNNPKRMRGFTPEEVSLLHDAARNSTPETILKMLGKFGVDLGSIRAAASGSALPVLTEVAGGKFGHPLVGTAITTGGTAAKYGQKLAARAKTERLLKAIENRKTNGFPMGQEIAQEPNPVNKAIGSPVINALPSQ